MNHEAILSPSRPHLFRVLAEWAFCLLCGLLVFVVFSHYYPVFSGTVDLAGRAVVAAILLLAAVLARGRAHLRPYSEVFLAFFVALAAISLDYYLGLSRWLIPALGLDANSPAGYAVDKLESSLLSIVTVILLVKASGNSLASLYLRRGNLRVGLAVGLLAFVVMTAFAIPVTEVFFGGRDLSWARILSWTPWVLLFILANAFNEELLFRGLFFGRLQPVLGSIGTNLVVAIPFVLMHTGVQYTPDVLMFLALTFPLSLAWGYLLQKTDSIWGSILFHAAMDIPVVLKLYSAWPAA